MQPGELIGGKYVVERIIGRGGVGIIAAARHVTLKQRVALKFLRPEVAHDPEVSQRFLREAQAAAQIRSEHVTRVMDTGVLEDGTVFLVFEYLEGRDLALVLREDGPLPIVQAVDYLMQACEAIAEAHALGIIHRDLKPANLFLTRAPDGAPFVKVLDFGLSKFNRSAAATALTADNHVIGSPHFMSPEQMRSSRDADQRSDLWALGVVLFGLLTGRVPFEGEYLTEVCAAVLEGKSLSLRALRPEAPPELEALVVRCLQIDPAERIQSVPELVEALRPFAPEGGQARAERIARVVGAAQRALATNAPPSAVPADRPADAVTHGSSPVSWSISVGHAQHRRAVSTPSAAALHDAQAGAATPPSTSAPSARPVSISVAERGARAAPRTRLVAAAVAALVAAMASALWLGRSPRDAAPMPATPSVPAPASLTSAPASPVPVPSPLAALNAAPATDLSRPAPAPSATARRPFARRAPHANQSTRSAIQTRRAAASSPLPVPAAAQPARPSRDEELILGLPH